MASNNNDQNKRKATDDHAIPAARRLKHDVDAMGCLIQAVVRDNQTTTRELNEVRESNRYLHRQVERLDGYTAELEGRLASMEALVGSLLATTHHNIVEQAADIMRETRQYDMTDIDRLLADYETEDELMDLLFGFDEE